MTTSKSTILSGFKEDCEELIARFDKAEDIRFQTFCEIWKAMQFSLIFTGRPNFLELLELCEESLNICKQFLISPPRFKERIGGLYLLYGIYYKKPIDDFKIRINLADWQSIMELHTEIKEAEHLDANYVLSKLIVDNAFHFCIFDSEYGLEKHYRTKDRQCFNPYSVLPMLKDLTDKDQALSQIDELSKTYEETKQLLQNPSDSSLKIFNSNIAEEIMGDIREFEEQRRSEQLRTLPDTEKSARPSSSRGKRKTNRKERGFYKSKVRALVDDGFLTDPNESSNDDDDDEKEGKLLLDDDDSDGTLQIVYNEDNDTDVSNSNSESSDDLS